MTPSHTKIPQSAADLSVNASRPLSEVERLLEKLTGGARILESAGWRRYQLSHDALARPVLGWRDHWVAVRSAQHRRREQRRRLFAVLLFTAMLLCIAVMAHAFQPLEAATVSARFEARGTQAPPPDVVLVTIDDESLERLGQTSLPLPRSMAAAAVDWIAGGDPKVIAYSVDFSGTKPGDEILAESIANADGRVVLASIATAPGGHTNVLGGDEFLASIRARAGFSGFTKDTTGVIRHPTYGVDGVRSFASKAAQVATGEAVPRSRFDGAWLDYYGPAGTLSSVPFWKILTRRGGERVSQGFFRDKIVVVGVTSPAAGDLHPVWGMHYRDMTGVEIQATAIDSIRRGLPLQDVPMWFTLLCVFMLTLVAPLLSLRFGLPVVLGGTLVIGMLYVGAALVAFEHDRVLQVVAPTAALLMAAFAVSILQIASSTPWHD